MGYRGRLYNWDYVFKEDYEKQTGNNETLQKYLPSSN